MGKTYWMLCVTQENFEITKQRGFDVQGIDSRNRRKAVRMSPEDRIVYYITDAHGFGGVATVTSEHFEDHEEIWKHHRGHEDFPHRVNIHGDVAVDAPYFVDGFQVGPTLEYVKKWAPEHWELAFFGMLHIIPQRDFNYLEAEIQRAADRAAKDKSSGRGKAKKSRVTAKASA